MRRPPAIKGPAPPAGRIARRRSGQLRERRAGRIVSATHIYYLLLSLGRDNQLEGPDMTIDRHMISALGALAAAAFGLAACDGPGAPQSDGADAAATGAPDAVSSEAASSERVDAEAMLALQEALSADALEGRRAGEAGSLAAREMLEARFAEIGLAPAGEDGYRQPFAIRGRDGAETGATGVNLIGRIDGAADDGAGGPVIILTAHYDHLGVREGEIFNGADDNASGTAAILAIAEALMADRPQHDVYIAALDAEEMGLQGARALVADPPVPLDVIALNINLDMVSRGDRGELYAVGTHHYPFLRERIERASEGAPIAVLFGHDRPEDGDQDWTSSSDHGAFHAQGVPFVYFGVEDHPDYHRPTDDFANVPQDFYVDAVEVILKSVRVFDGELEEIKSESGR